MAQCLLVVLRSLPVGAQVSLGQLAPHLQQAKTGLQRTCHSLSWQGKDDWGQAERVWSGDFAPTNSLRLFWGSRRSALRALCILTTSPENRSSGLYALWRCTLPWTAQHIIIVRM